MPFIGNYTPPKCEFNRVVMNFTVVSEGRQFDRLALMYFNDTEVWRTSTAEPTRPPGIRWVYSKDMTEYLYFWKSPQTLIFDLGNLIDDTYNGTFNATLTATFFNRSVRTNTAQPADLIIPVSARNGLLNEVSEFQLPGDNATNIITFPRNVNRAVFSISSCGQADEEFWWSNVLQSNVNTFNRTAGDLPGYSPWREVQLLVDGQLAGVEWPFPVIFTGGVVPSLNRPMVGLEAFDLREHEIDMTPWLSVLCDGSEHNFTIVVAGLDDDGRNGATVTQTVGNNWVVTGKIFLWLDDEGSVTTGTPPSVDLAGGPTITLSPRAVTQNSTGFNETLKFNINVNRILTVKATVNSQCNSGQVEWSQSLSYSNEALVTAYGYDQLNNFLIQGTDTANGPGISYKSSYGYPLYANSTFSVDPVQGDMTISARLTQGLQVQVEGNSVFPDGLEAFAVLPQTRNMQFAASLLNTSRDGTAFFFQTGDGKNSSGFGSTNQVFHFGGISKDGSLGLTSPDTELYFRNVTAINNTVVRDLVAVAATTQSLLASSLSTDTPSSVSGPQAAVFAEARGPGAFMGRTNT